MWFYGISPYPLPTLDHEERHAFERDPETASLFQRCNSKLAVGMHGILLPLDTWAGTRLIFPYVFNGLITAFDPEPPIQTFPLPFHNLIKEHLYRSEEHT